ncbi:putative MIC2-associated protein M2AP [Neospora caninum Liverpool]|uniref:MIC2-associated protein M2AP, putative n=2 Tax=Neospora caninum TaxID=29176 RepID=F0VL19_NEOCL|nr:putative MIC2-associated protein M2AP [Neospora caninum Liverpool]AAK74070.1 MIC2-associated protein precursor [Neospora caninum]CBZ54771.1 putative MIC2-associated protein M2AP [Neospora caninum Liverpool]CEL69488.1 TPA: MIC2-associated protein M2AP, putative [Neospora caninum Liverpool]|eukprot:XP_003884799.1 putative MIC2-associated protein M2AP [Neospora caninum Liverpool]
MVNLAAVSGAAFAVACFPAVVSARKAVGTAARHTSLVNEPVALAQLSSVLELVTVPCDAVHVQGTMGANDLVKITGAGWGSGALQFQVSHPVKTGGDKSRSQLASVTCYSSDATDAPEGKAGKCFLTKPAEDGSSDEPQETEVSLPITSHNNAFMFVCSASTAPGVQCDVYAFDNVANNGWSVKTLDLGLSTSTDLGFSVHAEALNTMKAYASSSLTVARHDISLGCKNTPVEEETTPQGEEA